MQAHAVLIDTGFVERDFLQDWTSTGSEIHPSRDVMRSLYFHAPFLHNCEAFRIGNDHCDDSSPCTKPLFNPTEKTQASESGPLECYHNDATSRSIDDHKNNRVCLLNGIDFWI